MGTSSLMDRSYRIAPDGQSVVCDALAERGDIDALSDALAWRRDELSRSELEDAGAVQGLRSLQVLDDMLIATTAHERRAPLTLDGEQVNTLCEIAGTYVAARDVDSYQAPEERDRIERLRGLAGSLMDCCAELAAAHDEVRERELSV